MSCITDTKVFSQEFFHDLIELKINCWFIFDINTLPNQLIFHVYGLDNWWYGRICTLFFTCWQLYNFESRWSWSNCTFWFWHYFLSSNDIATCVCPTDKRIIWIIWAVWSFAVNNTCTSSGLLHLESVLMLLMLQSTKLLNTSSILDCIDYSIPLLFVNFECKCFLSTILNCCFSWSHLISTQTCNDPLQTFMR